MLLEGEIRMKGEWDDSTRDRGSLNSGSEAMSVAFAFSSGLYVAPLGGVSRGSQGCQVAS